MVARNKYLNQRSTEMLMDYIGTWDAAKETFEMPSAAADGADEVGDEELVQKVIVAARETRNKSENLARGFKQFQDTLISMKGTEDISAPLTTSSASPSPARNSLTQSSASPAARKTDDNEAPLQELEEKRKALSTQLNGLNEKVVAKKQKLEEIKTKITQSGAKVEDNSNDSLSELRKKTDATAAAVEELKGTESWYTAVKSAMGMLSGIEIIETKAVDKKTLQITLAMELTEKDKMQQSATRKNTKAKPSAKQDDEYQLQLRITSGRVSEAIILGAAPIGASSSRMAAIRKVHTSALPSLEDLVTASCALEKPEDVRFVIRESKARLNNTFARAVHVKKLSERFTISHTNPDLTEVCVTIKPGVTANLALNVGYPTTSPSIESLSTSALGVGGHSDSDLDEVKEWANKQTWDNVLSMCTGIKERLVECALH